MTHDPTNPPLTRIPANILRAADYERFAPRFLAVPVHAYLAGGSGQDRTVHHNRRAFDHYQLVPRVLKEVSHGHTRLTLNRQHFEHPLFLAPVAHQRLVHPDAELETARAAEATDSCLLVSTLSSCRMEDIALHSGANRWFQLYFQSRRDDTLALVQRAAKAGYSAIVVTLDATVQVPSERALRSGFQLPAECVAANLPDITPAALPTAGNGTSAVFQGHMTQSVSVDDLHWLQDHCPLPIWIKGVMHSDDAKSLQSMGMAGLIVSNHGGRTFDGVSATLDNLPAIRQAVGNDYPLLFDGGIRCGQDAFKAMALGADAVLVGRLQVYASAIAGALGVAHMIKLLRQELELSMAITGCAQLSDIRQTRLHSVS